MKDSLQFSVSGIKCDNPSCDFKDETVKFEDYERWLNKPCPKCGAILLTEIDYFNTKMIMELTKIVNETDIPVEGDPVVTMDVEMDGTGKVDFIMDGKTITNIEAPKGRGSEQDETNTNC